MSKPMEPGRSNSSAPNFGPNRPSVDPKWDALQRAGADFSGYELEHPVDIAPFEADLYYVIRLLVVSSLISLLVTAFVVWPINRFVGTNLASSESVPVWILLSLLLTIGAIIMRCPWWLVAGCALSGPAASLYFGIVSASTRQGNGGARLVLVLLSLGLLGVLVDSIATHYLHWLTAGDHVLRSVRDRRRIWWGPRFNSGQLWLMKEELVQGAKQECGRGNISLAQAYLGHATELVAMLGYETGLTVLLVYAALAILPNGFFLLILVPPALVLFFRAGTETLEVLMTALEALFSWFSYGRFGTDAPGVFQSPIASCLTRGAFAVAVLFLLATVFTPPLPAFYGGILFSADWFWGLLLKFIGSLVLPVLVLLTVLVSAAGEILAQVRLATVEGGLDHALTDGKTRWDIFVEKIRASSHPVERDQLWLGLHSVSRYPVYLDPLILREHAHFLGDSGSGKTALGLAPLIVQIIQRALEAVIIIDLKGDMALFEAARLAAKVAGKKFKHFTNLVGLSTYVFNPFHQLMGQALSVNQICEIFLQALRLEHGEGYGRSFYSRAARGALVTILQNNPNIASFEELKRYTAVEFFANFKEREDCFDLISVIQVLASVPQLNFGQGVSDQAKKDAIYMPDVLKEKQVIYFWLPAAIESATVREIANLALYTLFATAAAPGNQERCTLVIDEFQRIAGEGFKLILQQARSMGLSTILANQTLSDLMLPESPGLQNVIMANTRFKQYFSATDILMQDILIKASGETLYLNSYSGIYADISSDSELEGQGLSVGPRLMRNDIIKLSADPQTSIVHITRDLTRGSRYGGLSFPVTSEFHVTEQEYKQRLRAPWPAGHAGTIVAPLIQRPQPSTGQGPANATGPASQNTQSPAGAQAAAANPTQPKARSKEGEKWAQRLARILQARTKLQ